MVFLKILPSSQENTSARVSFLIKLQASGLGPATSLKKGFGKCVFLLVLQNIQDHLFYRTPTDDCFFLYIFRYEKPIFI